MATITGTPDADDLSSANEGDLIEGLAGDDTLAANAADITLDGGAGGDSLFSFVGDSTLIGGPGDDLLIGSGTNDTASYENDPAGVEADLSAMFATDGYGGSDMLLGISNVTGSDFADSLTGDDLANVLEGGAGDDTLTGNDGADTFKFSFDFTQGEGGGETFSFTDYFEQNGGTVVDGEVADGTSQGQFSSLYTQWLESLGLTVLDLGQNSGPDGMPLVEGAAGTFGERESFEWTSGGGKKIVVHERWYSDTWTSDAGGGQDTVSSADGFDTILDFNFGEDKLEFNGLAGLTLDQFASFFSVTESDVNGDAVTDTVLALDDGTWGVTMLGVSGHSMDDFYNSSVFS